jgi:hypothetical protein
MRRGCGLVANAKKYNYDVKTAFYTSTEASGQIIKDDVNGFSPLKINSS